MNQYLIIVMVRLDLLTMPIKALVVPDLKAVAAFDAKGHEFTVFGFDGTETRELTDAEFREWERLSNQTEGVQNA